MKRHAGVLGEKRRAHQVHPLLAGPLGGLPGASSPPDPLAQTFGVRLDPKQPGWVGEHRSRVRLSEAIALEDLEKGPRVLASHLG